MQLELFTKTTTKMTHAKKGIELIVPERRQIRVSEFPVIKLTCANTGPKRTVAVRNLYLTHFMRDIGANWKSMFAGWKGNTLAIWEGDGGQDSFHISVSEAGKRGKPSYTVNNSALIEAMFKRYGISFPEQPDQVVTLQFKVVEMATDPGTYVLYLMA